MRRALLAGLLVLPLPGEEPGERVRRMQAAALASEVAHEALGELCDRIGARPCGSPAYAQAVAWAAARMRAWGLDAVRTEPVAVPLWTRGRERGELVEPVRRELRLLGQGMGVPTPPGGLEADVVVVGSFEELAALPDPRVRGRIVLFDAPFTSYGSLAQFRFRGPREVARRGGVAMLLRSVTDASLDTPHTGLVGYAPDTPPIPAAALTLEASAMLRRMQARGERLRLRLELESRSGPDVDCPNVLGEIRGRERPDEIVVVGGHLDSWDVGQGAQDDGVGCLLAMEAARLILATGPRPRRTVRVVLFANEEGGGRGGRAYAQAHLEELARHVAAVETDLGNGPIRGYTLELGGRAGVAALARLRALRPLLEPLGSLRLEPGGSGLDIAPLAEAGVPCLGVAHDTSRYWAIHHSPADTFEKVSKADFQRNAALLAALVYALAEAEPLRGPDPPSPPAARRPDGGD